MVSVTITSEPDAPAVVSAKTAVADVIVEETADDAADEFTTVDATDEVVVDLATLDETEVDVLDAAEVAEDEGTCPLPINAEASPVNKPWIHSKALIC